jgi:hypothetical protein
MSNDFELKNRAEFISGIRSLADWMEQHPSMPTPSSMGVANIYAGSRARLLELRHACGLKDKATFHDEYVGFRKTFSENVRLEVFCTKDKTCKRVQVGEKVIPATPEMLVPGKPERVEPVYEWKCPESILMDDDTGELVAAETEL